jgi:general secretion pathway protein C
MLSVLHSYYKPLCLVLLVLLGLAGGHLTDSLLQIKLRPGVTGNLPASQPVAVTPPKLAEADLNLILQQNLFDADKRSSTVTMNLVADMQGAEQAEMAAHPADLKLIGTVVAAGDSLALIEINKELKIFHLDDELPGGGVIETIERSQVTIRLSGQRLVTLLLHEGEPSTNSRATASSSRAAGSRPDATGDDLAGTIRAVGENRWMVSADLVESVRENFSEQLRLAQMQPRLVDGQTDGFLVRRINPRSILTKMGLQRGDVVIDVNSIKLDSPEKALQVFQQLREARHITVAVERQGQPMSFEYEIE